MRKTDIPGDIAVSMVLLTRLPLPALPERAFARQAQAVWAFPLVGFVVALIACGVAASAMWFGLPAMIAAGMLLGVQTVLIGAMHEDGLADTADGLWGGFTTERRLEIMKDSHIGTYGVLALILCVGLRWLALGELLSVGAFGAIFATAMLSRAAMPCLMTALPSARAKGLSQSVGVPSWKVSGVAVMIAGLATLTLTGAIGLVVCGLVAACALGVGCLARVKIGGQTGDILGATQVSCETLALLVWVTLM